MKNCIMSFLILFILVPVLMAAEVPKTFDELDDDQDGYISKSEAKEQTELSKAWKGADKDSDERLDIAEFSAYYGKERFTPPEGMEEPEIGAAPFDPVAEID